jgi:tryptophan-rich sensory protein
MICVLGILLEGICAGTRFKEYLQSLKWPSYSPRFWAWYLIAILYYAVVFTFAVRILSQPATLPFQNVGFTLLLLIVVLNAVWNLLFFRANNLAAAFVLSICYSVVVFACWYYLIQVDAVAAVAIGFYGVYLVFASVWGYRVWRLNRITP